MRRSSQTLYNSIEYRRGPLFERLGTFLIADQGLMRALCPTMIGASQALVESKGLPADVSHETWLETQMLKDSRQQGNQEILAQVKVGRMVGADIDHLIGAHWGYHDQNWLTATEWRTVLTKYRKKNKAASPSLDAITTLLESLPEGRIVYYRD